MVQLLKGVGADCVQYACYVLPFIKSIPRQLDHWCPQFMKCGTAMPLCLCESRGSQGKLCWVIQCLLTLFGFGGTVRRCINAPTLEAQRKAYEECMLIRFIMHGPRALVWLFCKVMSFLMFNRIVLW
jgi:hypothetical protein